MDRHASGQLFSGRAGGRTFEGPRLNEWRSRLRGPVPLQALELGAGRVIIAAADDTEVAREEVALRHGVFTHFVLRTLEEAGATGATIGVHELYQRVAASVRAHTHYRQHPVLNGRMTSAQLPTFVFR